MISVLMSTFNGQEYIEDQLESIFNQTVQPDEVIIVDDCSKDKTCELIELFIRDHDLSGKWLLYRNTLNKGWKKNFIDGLSMVSGDYVLFSDQDDIWFKNKIEESLNYLETSSCKVVCTDEIEWSGNEEISLDNRILSGSKIELDVKRNYLIHCSGCSMMLDMKYVRKVLPYYTDGCAHDDFFWKVGLLDGTLYKISQPLFLHRIHGNNESRKKRNYVSTLENTKKELRVVNKLIKYIDETKYDRSSEEYQELLNLLFHKKQGFKLRKELLSKKKIYLSFLLFFRYSDIFRHNKELIKDIYLALRH